jgi:hypothetical protein
MLSPRLLNTQARVLCLPREPDGEQHAYYKIHSTSYQYVR